MLSSFRTMDAAARLEATAATAAEPWQFGFLVPLGESAPALFMRMPKDVDPNAEDPWKFTVVDDCLYVFLPKGESPAGHLIDAACDDGQLHRRRRRQLGVLRLAGRGPLAARVARGPRLSHGAGFRRRPAEPLWQGGPGVQTQGFELDPADPSGPDAAPAWTTCGSTPAIRPASRAKRC